MGSGLGDQCVPHCLYRVPALQLDPVWQSAEPHKSRTVLHFFSMELPKEYKTPHPMNSLPPEVDGEKGAVYDPSNGDDPAAYHSRGSTHVEAMNRMDQEHNLPITGKRNSTW